ncbi:hypothetical protein LEMLEM_LOCUS15070 [Lemmus lemmus]
MLLLSVCGVHAMAHVWSREDQSVELLLSTVKWGAQFEITSSDLLKKRLFLLRHLTDYAFLLLTGSETDAPS